MTLSRIEELQLRTALLAQQLVELTPAAPETASSLLLQLTGAVREQCQRATDGAPDPLSALRRLELERLLGEASTLTHDEPRWRATLQDLRAAIEAHHLEAQPQRVNESTAFVESRSSGHTAGGSLT